MMRFSMNSSNGAVVERENKDCGSWVLADDALVLEAKLKKLAQAFLESHAGMKVLLSSDGNFDPCECEICLMCGEILQEVKNEIERGKW